MVHYVVTGETLAIIAKNYRRSIRDILKANPAIQNQNYIFPGQGIIIPDLPDPTTIPFQIKVSISRRLLTLLKSGTTLKTYKIAVGKMVTSTPPGSYVIVNREPNPGGPYGVMWLSLSKAGYGIHGTNNPASIGKAVSLGCIRMYNHDVLEVARMVPNGTRVTISN